MELREQLGGQAWQEEPKRSEPPAPRGGRAGPGKPPGHRAMPPPSFFPVTSRSQALEVGLGATPPEASCHSPHGSVPQMPPGPDFVQVTPKQGNVTSLVGGAEASLVSSAPAVLPGLIASPVLWLQSLDGK